MTSKPILLKGQGPHGSKIYNTLKKKAEAPTLINNDLNNSSTHFTVYTLRQTKNEKEADVSDVQIIDALMSKDETGDRDSQEGLQRVNSKGDQTSCNECRTMSDDIAKIKLDLSLLYG